MIRPEKQNCGFTLIEALIASTILAATVLAITLPFSLAAKSDVAAGGTALASSLAQELMEEILSKPFADPNGSSKPGGESGETSRSKFDNIDDYDGYSETAGNIVRSDGTTVTDSAAAGLSRSVEVAYVRLSGQGDDDPVCFVRIVITVKRYGKPLLTLTRVVYSADAEDDDSLFPDDAEDTVGESVSANAAVEDASGGDETGNTRLCLKTRSGFGRLHGRLTASQILDKITEICLRFCSLPANRSLGLGPTPGFPDRT